MFHANPRHRSPVCLRWLSVGICLFATACVPPAATIQTLPPTAATAAAIPEPLRHMVSLPPPGRPASRETYSVAVDNIDVRELLYSLARDSGINVDIHPGIAGRITMTAREQTLAQVLNRISRQADLRWQVEGDSIVIQPDSPFLRTYVVDYVNVARETSGTLQVTTQIAATGGGATDPVVATGNNSSAQVSNRSQNKFWETLERNIKELLRETDKILPDGSSETSVETHGLQPAAAKPRPAQHSPDPTLTLAPATTAPHGNATEPTASAVVKRITFREAASVIVNPETGVITVRASGQQHEKVQEFLVHVAAAARRQVLIEATIAEVTLTQGYQQGIDWSALPLAGRGTSLIQGASGAIDAPASSFFSIAYRNPTSQLGNLAATLKWLESFGTVRVMSSPTIAVINNQTAVLKVVDNIVYFTLKADTVANQTTATTTYTTQLHSVPVGLVLTVTPQVSDADTVLLTVRPSISRRYGQVIDPNPELQRLGVSNPIPVIRTREMESIVRIDNGQVAVMGGLMEESEARQRHAVPLLADLPGAGQLFQNRDESRQKTELVIFLRPTVITDASLAGDYAAHQAHFAEADRQGTPLPKPAARPRPAAPMAASADPIIQIHPVTRAEGLASAYSAFRRGDVAVAEQRFAALADERPTDAYRGLASLAWLAGNIGEAIEHCRTLASLDPGDLYANACLIALLPDGDPVAAEARLRSLLARNAGSAILHFVLANALAAQQRWAEARQAYAQANVLQPGDAATLLNLAVSCDHLRQIPLARGYYHQALAAAAPHLPEPAAQAAQARIAALAVPSPPGRP